VCLISAGEVTVQISGNAGVGGRNQQFALEMARRLAGVQGDVAVLSAGSDGVDGNSPAAGAVADASTWKRAEMADLQPETALLEFDSYRVLDGLGDAIVTGPTGNNLRDLRVLVSQ
jgi:hydroxypyruvate reductase